MSDSEKWAIIDIPNSSDKFEISSLGQVRKTKSNRVVSILGGTISSGSRYVYLAGYQYAVHRLVANAFIPNPEGYKRVIHKDGDRLNNSVDNLMWSNKTSIQKKNANASKIELLCPEAKLVFSSLRSAAYYTHIPQDIISKAIQENSTICGLTFQWVDSNSVQDYSICYISFDEAYQKALSSSFVKEFHSEIEKLTKKEEN